MIGLTLIVLSVLWPITGYWDLAAKYNNAAILSQYLGSVSLILMGTSQLMATRAKGLESLFGGLDRLYLYHKWLGILAMAAMMLHDTVDADIKGLGRKGWLADIAEESGEIALYGLLILVVISLTTFIPYEIWKKTHKFIGAFFVLSAFHYLFINKPFETADPLGLYISAFCLIGIASYMYMLVLHGMLERKHPYKITNLIRHGSVTELELSPIKKGLRHKAGQFAFIYANGESHPFTIACAPNDERRLTFAIKQLGDFTKQLGLSYETGDTIEVSRAFGKFTFRPKKHQTWVAGGIGITPFLAWIDQLEEQAERKIDLFYAVRTANDLAVFQDRLIHPNITLHPCISEEGKRLSPDMLNDKSKDTIYFCGPKSLRQDLQKDHRVKFEEFEMRSGLNLRFLFALIKRLADQRRSNTTKL